jgi:hypothetical protein
MQLIVFNFEITYRIGKTNFANRLFRRLDHKEVNKEKINLLLFTLSNKFNYWRNKINQSSSAEDISVMSINIAVLIRRQIKNDAYILFTFKNEAVRDTSAYRGF